MKIVGIGASAGGIEAFRLFFENLPPDSGIGFVIVLHPSADRKSLLTEIIGRWTQMEVSEAANNDLVEPNRVYVIPPGHVATMQQGRLHLRHFASDVPREATPIDQFFDSLAADFGQNAIGIVLSGTGHDGALGLKAIKARGGLTLAQGTDGTAPQHNGMPNSAIATGAVDLIVPVQDDLVVMDNLGSHKGTAVRRAIRQAGAKLFLLPKYSPDLNPIEQVFAKLKHTLRKASARTKDAVCKTIGKVLSTYTPQECANYLKHSGYHRT